MLQVGAGETPGDAEIEQRDVLGVHAHDVGRVRVAMEEPVLQDLLEPGVCDGLGQTIALGNLERVDIELVQGGAFHPFQGQHAPARVRPEDAGYRHRFGVGEFARETLGVTAFQRIVQLSEDGAGELVHHADRIHEEPVAEMLLQQFGDLVEEIDVPLDLAGGLGTLHLHGYVHPSGKDGAVHLPDGGGREGNRIEGDKEAFGGEAEVLLDHAAGLLAGKRGHLVLEAHQLGHDLVGQQVGTRAEKLPELDEGRAELLEELADVPPELRGRRTHFAAT